MNVLVAIYGDHPWNLPAGHVEYLRRRFSHVTFAHAAGEQELMAHIASADVGFLGAWKPPASPAPGGCAGCTAPRPASAT